MRNSTGLRDLALHLEDEAARLHEMGYPEWASHIGADASCLLRRAERLAHAEPPQSGIESLAGIDPGFGPADQREAMLEDLLRYMLRCSDEHVWPTSRIGEVRAVLGEQGEDGSG